MVVNSKNECTNVFGARSKLSFVFSFSKRKNQKAFVRFLAKLLLRWGRFACLSIMGLVTTVRYWMRSWFRIGKHFGSSIFPNIRLNLILLSNAGNQLERSFRIDSFCRFQQQNIIWARHLKTRPRCLKCLNIYLISYNNFKRQGIPECASGRSFSVQFSLHCRNRCKL